MRIRLFILIVAFLSILPSADAGVGLTPSSRLRAKSLTVSILTRIYGSMSYTDKNAVGKVVVSSMNLLGVETPYVFTSLTAAQQAELTITATSGWSDLGTVDTEISKAIEVELRAIDATRRTTLQTNNDKIITVIENYMTSTDVSQLNAL